MGKRSRNLQPPNMQTDGEYDGSGGGDDDDAYDDEETDEEPPRTGAQYKSPT